jgi:hypothetical protein
MAAIGTRLPPSILEMVAEAEGGEVSRPDILIAHRLDVPWEAQIHIVEFKYCRDTDREARQAAGASQHETLVKCLKQNYLEVGKVILHVVTLSVAGTVYNDFLQMMEAMQVPKREAMRYATKLHAHAVNYLKRIMHMKWSQESSRRHKDAG